LLIQLHVYIPIAIGTVVFELLCPDNSCNLKSDSYREFVFFPIGQVVFVFVKEDMGFSNALALGAGCPFVQAG